MSNGRLTENGALPDSISLTGGCMGSSATLQSGHTMTGGTGEIFPGKDGVVGDWGREDSTEGDFLVYRMLLCIARYSTPRPLNQSSIKKVGLEVEEFIDLL